MGKIQVKNKETSFSEKNSRRVLVRAHLFLPAEECRIKQELLLENKRVKWNLGLKVI